MPTIQVPYAKTTLTATLPDDRRIEMLSPREVVAAPDPMAEVERALAAPAGGKALSDFTQIRSVAIAINDKTRPVPHQYLLPPLLAQLDAMHISPQRITLLIATGTHPVMPPEEYAWILPQRIIQQYPIICHDITDEDSLMHLGTTSRGTPVYVNRAYMQADLRIVVGNVEPHQFMGFSGGVKSAVIGLAGKETINHNHAMMLQPQAAIGRYDDNPMRQDVEEMGRMVGVHFALNAVLNDKKQIVRAFAGEPVALMHEAIPRMREIFQREVSAPFDVLVVSPGGYPKDINVYQAQKALGHASLVMRDGGTVILCAACNEGTGSTAYETWVMNERIRTHEDVFKHFADEGFRVGPHKAFQISRDASRMQVMLISQMPDEFVRRLLLHPLPDLQTALNKALASLPADGRIGVMPIANATIPVLAEQPTT